MDLPFQKQSNEYFNKLSILNFMLSIIDREPISISELGRRLKMSRGKVRHYLSLLKEENLIVFEEQKKQQGKPTLIKPNEEKAEEEFKRIKKLAEKYQKEMLENPITKKTLQVIKNNSNFNTLEIVQEVLKKHKDSEAEVYSIINWLKINKYIKETYSLTEQGIKFLKQHSEK